MAVAVPDDVRLVGHVRGVGPSAALDLGCSLSSLVAATPDAALLPPDPPFLVPAPSALGERAGMGLVTQTALAKGSLVCYYAGKDGAAMSAEAAEKVVDKGYLMRLAPDVYINGKHGGRVARFVNDPRNKAKYNVTFVKMPERRCAAVVALRDVAPGEELFVDYGSAYWFGRRKTVTPVTLA